MDHDEMRLECIRMAMDAGAKGDAIIEMAELFFSYALQRGKFSGMKYERVPNNPPKAKVVGRDTKFEKPFKDYLSKDE